MKFYIIKSYMLKFLAILSKFVLLPNRIPSLRRASFLFFPGIRKNKFDFYIKMLII